uniref:acetate--CoA ligase n=1 Tax=Myotis lucifugus TaxID=59463 RepID=G1NTX5_MYOLU
AVNCLDRHVQKSPESVALIWERDEPGTEVRITYRELLETTCRLANTLKRHGVRRGDRVAIYMPVSPQVVAAMLACARIGAVHNVVFAGFSAQSLAGRINDAKCKVVITINQGLRGGRVLELKKIVDEAVKHCPTVQHVLVAHRTENKVPMGKLDVPLEEAMAKEDTVCAPESMGSEDMLFLLYTSGSTGKPKGLVHTQAGYLLFAALTHKSMGGAHLPGGIGQGASGVGWKGGHALVFAGPYFKSKKFTLVKKLKLRTVCGNYNITVSHLEVELDFDIPSVDQTLSVAEPKAINLASPRARGSLHDPSHCDSWWVGLDKCGTSPSAHRHFFPVIPIETGGICIAPRPSEEGAEILPAMAMRPFFGIIPVLMDDKGNVLEGNNVSGALCLSQAWPGLSRTIYGNHQRFLETYFKAYPGLKWEKDSPWECAGVEGESVQTPARMAHGVDASGCQLGRVPVSDKGAHGSMSNNSALPLRSGVKGESQEHAVVIRDYRGEKDTAMTELSMMQLKKPAGFAVESALWIVKRLPKTRSGKVMRRLLRKIITGKAQDLGDTTTLEDPNIISEILSAYQKHKDKNAARQ